MTVTTPLGQVLRDEEGMRLEFVRGRGLDSADRHDLGVPAAGAARRRRAEPGRYLAAVSLASLQDAYALPS